MLSLLFRLSALLFFPTRLKKSPNIFPSDNSAGLLLFCFFPRALCLVFLLRVSSPPSIGLRATHLPGTLPEIGGPSGAPSSTPAASLASFFLTRRENLRIRDLLGPIPRWLVPKGIACLLLVFPSFMVSEPVARRIAYHSWRAPIPHLELLSRHLPVWAVFYSLLIWWPIWSVTEELTYNGYLASRFAGLSRHRWVAYALVGFWWALQHSFLPFTFEWRFLLYKLFMFLPCGFILIAIYLRTRKLAPLILAHWMMDISGALFTLSL